MSNTEAQSKHETVDVSSSIHSSSLHRTGAEEVASGKQRTTPQR